jgi:hypothetical protein
MRHSHHLIDVEFGFLLPEGNQSCLHSYADIFLVSCHQFLTTTISSSWIIVWIITISMRCLLYAAWTDNRELSPAGWMASFILLSHQQQTLIIRSQLH